MADNKALNATTVAGGPIIATDEIGGIDYQRVKVCWGDNGTANDTSASANNQLPVTVYTPNGDSVIDDTNDAFKVVQSDATKLLVTEASAGSISTSAATLADAVVVDNAAFADGTTKVLVPGFIYDDVAGTALTENDAAAARIDSKRSLVTSIEDATTRGRRLALAAAATAPVANDIAAIVSLSPNMSTVAAALCKAEDAAHSSGDVGVQLLGVRSDTHTAARADTNGDYVPLALDKAGVQVVRPRQIATYGATYRLGDATAGQLSLTFTFTANTNKQLATIYHTAGSTKDVYIRRIVLSLGGGALGVFNFEVRPLSSATAPASGNPAITPGKYDPADGAAESTCLALPTTAGSLVAADSPVSCNFEWNSAALATTALAGLSGSGIVLFDASARDGIKPLKMRAGSAEGYAVNGRCTTNVALRFSVYIEFTEE